MILPPPTTVSLLGDLQEWFLAQCNGGWEHAGIRIVTLDNPGWAVSINLLGTSVAGVAFTPVTERASEHVWVHCEVRDGCFEGAGGPRELGRILRIFLDWVRATEAPRG